MKLYNLFLISVILLAVACGKEQSKIDIDATELLENVKLLSHDSLAGRKFTEIGNLKARKYIQEKFQSIGLNPLYDDFVQEFSVTLQGRQRQAVFPIKKPLDDLSNVKDTAVVGGNVVGTISGYTNNSIVITAHYDHLGIQKGYVFNGADDNASGVSALLTIAKYFKNKPTKHTLIFAAVDAQEAGSLGAQDLINTYPNKKDIALNINMDMISHSDFDPELYVCGTYHYVNLKSPIEDIETEYVRVLFGHDDPYNKEQYDWTFISDHKVFHREQIPFLYFGVEDHKDYHQPTDTFDTINQEFYIESVKIIIRTIEILDELLYEENE